VSHTWTDAEPKGSGSNRDSADLWTAIREVIKLISPDDEIPVDQRLEQLGLCPLRDIITAQHEQLAVQRQHIALLTAHTTSQQMTLDRLQTDVRLLMASADMRPHLIGGRLPAASGITQLKVQIFHSPDLPPNERKAKTEWSLRLTVWVNGLRAVEEIKGVQLYSCKQFADKVAVLAGEVPDVTRDFAERFADRDDEAIMAGMLRAKTRGKGTPYIRDQFCILGGHLDDAPEVVLSLGGEDIEINKFRPAAGVKAGHAKWWGEWSR